jgi:hypothetical protein
VLLVTVPLTAIRTAEPPAPRAPRHLLADIRHGLRLVAGHRVRRALAASSAVSNLAFAVASAVTVIFWTRDLVDQRGAAAQPVLLRRLQPGRGPVAGGRRAEPGPAGAR